MALLMGIRLAIVNLGLVALVRKLNLEKRRIAFVRNCINCKKKKSELYKECFNKISIVELRASLAVMITT